MNGINLDKNIGVKCINIFLVYIYIYMYVK